MCLATACKKLIQIPPNQPGNVVTSQVFSDSATAQSAVLGIYSAFGIGSTALGFTNGGITIWAGLSADELNYIGTDRYMLELNDNTLVAQNPYILTLWSTAYGNPFIYGANVCIANLTGNTALSPTLRAQLLGEVKMLRAWFYFYLVQLYGPVPLATSDVYQTNQRLPRTDTGAVYQQIDSDLSDAEGLLVAQYPSQGRLRPNLYTALALQARVDLYRQQWAAAEAAATQVIGAGLYSLEPDPGNVFLDGSNEAIWQVQCGAGVANYAQTTSEGELFIPNPYYAGAPVYSITPSLLSVFSQGDKRLSAWIGAYPVDDTTYYYPAKYKCDGANASSVPLEDYMVFRLGEQYLIRAEARAQQGKTSDALADLNMIRERAGLADTVTASQAATLTAIMQERRRELFCEWGNRWMDLKRTGLADAVLGAEKTNWVSTQALYPIPFSQMQVDPSYTQNPGY